MSNNYYKKIEELEITVDVRDAKIASLKYEIERLKSKLHSYEDEEKRFTASKKRLEEQYQTFYKRQKSAQYYDSLIILIENNPSLQGEWIKFMTLIKLVCDPEDVEGLT